MAGDDHWLPGCWEVGANSIVVPGSSPAAFDMGEDRMIDSAHGLGLASGEAAGPGVRHLPVRFRTASPWRGGYNRTDVDHLVAAVCHELDRLQKANAEAEREIERLRAYFRNRGIEVGDAGGVRFGSGQVARSSAADNGRAAVPDGLNHHDQLVDEPQTFVGRVTWPATQRADAN